MEVRTLFLLRSREQRHSYPRRDDARVRSPPYLGKSEAFEHTKRGEPTSADDNIIPFLPRGDVFWSNSTLAVATFVWSRNYGWVGDVLGVYRAHDTNKSSQNGVSSFGSKRVEGQKRTGASSTPSTGF
jgi:hypothetical protein